MILEESYKRIYAEEWKSVSSAILSEIQKFSAKNKVDILYVYLAAGPETTVPREIYSTETHDFFLEFSHNLPASQVLDTRPDFVLTQEVYGPGHYAENGHRRVADWVHKKIVTKESFKSWGNAFYGD